LEAIRAQFKSRDTLELYAELRSVDPERAKRLSPNDRVRITRALEIYAGSGRTMSEHMTASAARSAKGEKAKVLKLVLTMPRERLRDRIADRTRAMYSAGWADEVRRLLDAGHGPDSPGMRGIGYEEISSALLAGSDPIDTVDEVIVRTQQYAKRQETFFRKYNGAVWLDVTGDDFLAEAQERVTDFLA
jgi:tRNA dimethylallyltransferase